MLKLLVKKSKHFGWKHFPSIKKGTPPPFVKPLDLISGTSLRGIVDLSILGGNFFLLSKNGTAPPFVKPLDLTSGIFVRGIVGLILVRNVFNYFNFYSIDL